MQKNISKYQKKYQQTLSVLNGCKKVLLLTTSNRWVGETGGEMPKSTALAYKFAKDLGQKATVIEVPKLKIYPCEGNVSTGRGNTCGIREALLKDPQKNPTCFHRCFASLNNSDDELWKISKELFVSDAVVFFGSVRWGQLNSEYQKLIERLTWLENRHSTLQENNVVQNISAGVISVGQNWHGKDANDTQREVLSFFGFKVNKKLSWHWQFTNDKNDESDKSYVEASKMFKTTFGL